MSLTKREELLQFDGVGRIPLERRVVALVRLYDAVQALVSADAAGDTDRALGAFDALRAALESL